MLAFRGEGATNQFMSSDAVYAGVNTHVRYCRIYLNQRLGYSEALPWQKGQRANLGQSGGSSAMTDRSCMVLTRLLLVWQIPVRQVINQRSHLGLCCSGPARGYGF